MLQMLCWACLGLDGTIIMVGVAGDGTTIIIISGVAGDGTIIIIISGVAGGGITIIIIGVVFVEVRHQT